MMRRVVLGEIAREDSSVQRLLAGKPHLVAELNEMLAAQRLIARVAAHENQALQSATHVDAPEIDVTSYLRELARQDPSGPRGDAGADARGSHRGPSSASVRPRSWPQRTVALLAAVALVAFGWWLRGLSTPASAPRSRGVLDQTAIEGIASERHAAGARIHWRDPGQAAHYKVRVTAPGLALESESLRRPEWVLPLAQTAEWPAQITVEVLAYDDMGMFQRKSVAVTLAWPP